MKPQPYKQGGMATIWLGKEKGTNRNCIIKTPAAAPISTTFTWISLCRRPATSNG